MRCAFPFYKGVESDSTLTVSVFANNPFRYVQKTDPIASIDPLSTNVVLPEAHNRTTDASPITRTDSDDRTTFAPTEGRHLRN
jgi:hypothetical protein